ncbi:MAG: ABC transporter permease, partial [Cyanobacteria bacterium K_DeepCast_35m_m2_023]|nr:ABC transporter permease [Cyanobacteria bacterium K_DeepCast_35m_m2_023]
MPTRRQEDWRFNDLSLLGARQPRLWSGANPLAAITLPKGVMHLDPTLAESHWQQLLTATGCTQHWPVRLNGSASPAALSLLVNAEAEPLCLDLDAGSADEVLALRLLLVIEPGADLTVCLRLRSSGPSVTSVVCAAVMAENARLSLASVSEGHGDAVLMAHLPVL